MKDDEMTESEAPGFKCPTCGALLYSRNAGRCTECRATLPDDLQLSDASKRDIEETKVREKKAFKGYMDSLATD